jgi:uncharacterized protein (DUF433 family)
MAAVLDRLIVSEPGFRGGRPRIANTRLTVADIALLHLRLGQTPVEIAGRYDVAMAAVYAALAFYFDHRAEIDADIAADEAYAVKDQAAHPDTLLSRVRLAAGG